MALCHVKWIDDHNDEQRGIVDTAGWLLDAGAHLQRYVNPASYVAMVIVGDEFVPVAYSRLRFLGWWE